MEHKKRPIAITILAVINFIFAGLTMVGLIFGSFIESAWVQPFFEKPFFEVFSKYTLFLTVSLPRYFLSPILIILGLLLSGTGFLKGRWDSGYIIGNITSIVMITMSVLSIVINSDNIYYNLPHIIPTVTYFLILILFLNFYKEYFVESKGKPEERPLGLTIFATYNFILAGLTLLDLNKVILSVQMIYTIIAILLVLSGIGFLKIKRRLGYILGNITAIAMLLLIIWSVTITNYELISFTQFLLSTISGMIYPLLLLLLLNLRYKKYFRESYV